MWWHTRRIQISSFGETDIPFKSARASVQSTTGSRGVRISGSNAGYTMFRGSVKGMATHSIRQFPLHFPSRASPCAITFQLYSTHDRVYEDSIVIVYMGVQNVSREVAACNFGVTQDFPADEESNNVRNVGTYIRNPFKKSSRIARNIPSKPRDGGVMIGLASVDWILFLSCNQSHFLGGGQISYNYLIRRKWASAIL